MLGGGPALNLRDHVSPVCFSRYWCLLVSMASMNACTCHILYLITGPAFHVTSLMRASSIEDKSLIARGAFINTINYQ